MPEDAATEPHEGLLQSILRVLKLATVALALYLAAFGTFDEVIVRGGIVGLAIVGLCLEMFGKFNSAGKGPVLSKIWVSILIVAAITAAYFFIFRYLEAEIAIYEFTDIDHIIGAFGFITLLEVTRRIYGLPLFLVCIIVFAYAIFGKNLPGIFEHAGFSFAETFNTVWYSFDGVYGRALSVVIQVILIFIIFGAVLESTGASSVLLKIAVSLTSRLRGGPAHAAVIGSAVFGTVSGSAMANVVGTGVFTIPLIKSRGFSPKFAGAVEAAASSGGQITPPVMGAVAFIMADVTGISYLTIAAAALVPALLYYFSLFVSILVEAKKCGIEPVPGAEREKITVSDWLQSIIFIIPILSIVFVLVMGRSPATAGLVATIIALILGLILNRNFRAKPLSILSHLSRAGHSCWTIVVAVAAVGIVIGVMNMTGLGIRFSNVILSFSGDSILVSLVLLMLGCLVLGMGMPTVPAYLLIVMVMGPAITKLGVSVLLTHLFVVYYAVFSNITPPVALAAFAAAPIAGSKPLETGFEASRVALTGLIIPYIFVFNPSLSLVEGFDLVSFLWALGRTCLASWLIAEALSGMSVSVKVMAVRVLFAALAVCLFLNIEYVAFVATGIAIAVLVQRFVGGTSIISTEEPT